ncbi:MAG: hypothetical protein ACREJC_20575 [Tepidisphaeraceae bacterium]
MRHWSRAAAAFAIVALTAPLLRAEPATRPASSEFLRFVDRGSSGSRLETADVAYRDTRGVTVHLVSAVHIADADYYKGLNENFKLHDAVLYEMVKPQGSSAPMHGVESQSGVSQFQRFLKDSLELEFQLDAIDYSPANFMHADLDSETFQKLQEQRGETMMTLMIQAMMRAMAQPQGGLNQPNPDEMFEDLIRVFTRPDAHRQMKLMLAKNLSQIEDTAMGLDGPGGSVILTERNKAAVAAMEQAIADGKKDIVIFYGAAHMPDLATRLAGLGFSPVATEWRQAWDLTIRADEPSAVEKMLIELFKEPAKSGESRN